jgi:hypothetical protein
MDAVRNADSDLGAMEVLVTIKGFERSIQQGYSEELGIDESKLDGIVSKLIDSTKKGGEEISPQTLEKTIEITKEQFE